MGCKHETVMALSERHTGPGKYACTKCPATFDALGRETGKHFKIKVEAKPPRRLPSQ